MVHEAVNAVEEACFILSMPLSPFEVTNNYFKLQGFLGCSIEGFKVSGDHDTCILLVDLQGIGDIIDARAGCLDADRTDTPG